MNLNILFWVVLFLNLVGRPVICQLVGAVYFMSNDPSGNSVIASGISSDGKLISSTAFQTGGYGGISDYSAVAGNGLDPLGSQNSLLVSGNLLFAVNAVSNSISVFTILETDPTSLTLEGTIWSGGEFPISLSFSQTLQLLCVLNGGKNNNLQCFKVPIKSPKQIEILPQFRYSFGVSRPRTPPTANYTLSDINFSPDSTQLFVSVKGNNQLEVNEKGRFLAFDLTNDQLYPPTKVQPNGATNPFGFTFVPGTGEYSDSVLAYSDYGTVQGGGGFGVVQIDRNGEVVGDAIFRIVPGQINMCWTVFSPRTGSLYLTDPLTNTVTEAKVTVYQEGLNAGILTQHTVDGAPLDVTVVSLQTMDILYILAPGLQAIQVLAIEGAGEARIIQTFDPVQNGASVSLGRNMVGIANYLVKYPYTFDPVENGARVSLGRNVAGIANYALKYPYSSELGPGPSGVPKLMTYHHDKNYFWKMILFK